MLPEALVLAVYRRLPAALQVRAVRHGTPNFTVGTAGLITEDGSQLLLVRNSYREGWLPPGGLLRRRELPMDGLRREVVEELGVALDFAEPHRVPLAPQIQTVTYISVAVAPAGADFRPRSPEVLECRWFPLDDLPPPPGDYTEGITAQDLVQIVAKGTGG